MHHDLTQTALFFVAHSVAVYAILSLFSMQFFANWTFLLFYYLFGFLFYEFY